MALTKWSKRRASKPKFTRDILVVHSKSWKQRRASCVGSEGRKYRKANEARIQRKRISNTSTCDFF